MVDLESSTSTSDHAAWSPTPLRYPTGAPRRSTDAAHEVRIAAHHQLITSPRKPHVEPFFGSVPRRGLVQCENDDAPLQAFEPEDVAVEDLIVVPEGVPISLWPLLLPRDLLIVPATGCEQSDVLETPAVVE